jgi:ABC-type branched-subunit amino acid transport system ATPase component
VRLLEVVGLAKAPVLEGVSFTVEEGATVAVVGPPGSGKSACLACIAGAAVPEGGRVIFDGRDVTARVPGLPPPAGMALSIARAQTKRPRLLLLDDPFAGLSPEEIRSAVEQLRALRVGGLTILIAERRAAAVSALAARVVVLEGGRVSDAAGAAARGTAGGR